MITVKTVEFYQISLLSVKSSWTLNITLINIQSDCFEKPFFNIFCTISLAVLENENE